MTDDSERALAPPARFQPRRPLVIGLLGGIAAGKSDVAAAFARHGLRHVDADLLARQVSADPAILQAVATAFGPDVLAADGSLRREVLAARVFADPAQRSRLEAILHPPVRQAILASVASAVAAGDSVLLDVPLLLENGLIAQCQATVFVDAPLAVRQQRARTRGWADGELERREQAQAPLAQKKAAATYTIDNGGDRQDTARQVARVLAELAISP